MAQVPVDGGSETTTHVEASQATKKADLVLEGGGVKGIGLVGAISVLEEHGYAFPRVAGTSAGAIVGSLVASGVKGNELHDLIVTIDYESFCDDTPLDHIPVAGKGLSLWFEHGIFKGEYFHGWISDQLANAGVRTFADLYQPDEKSSLPANQQYRFVGLTSDVTRGRLLRLPWDYPSDGIDANEQLVADAIRASMSIPFFYRPVTLDVRGAAPSTLVDGGMLSNFPVDVFDRTDGQQPRWPTIGIKLSARQPPNMPEHRVRGDVSLAMAMLGTMQSWSDQMHLDDPAVLARTIFVDTFGINATDFSIDRATQEKLYQSGRSAAEKFVATQHS
jgi:NTE family protein